MVDLAAGHGAGSISIPNKSDWRARAARIAGDFEQRVSAISYEAKGILFSEMLFASAILDDLKPRRIIESGRARGQSTHLLASCFPDLPIVSIEYDASSPDVGIAAARLAPFANVELLFGDATRMLPQMLRPGDAVFIDGPKGARALRLALRLLATGMPVAVFVHDCPLGSFERDFLAARFGRALFGDDDEFVRSFRHLDRRCMEVDPAVLRPSAPPGTSYGPTFACLFPSADVRYAMLRMQLVIDGNLRRWRSSARKRWADR